MNDIKKTPFEIVLKATDEELLVKFSCLQTRADVANLLEISEQSLIYWLYRKNNILKYKTFYLFKKNGGVRQIDAPIGSIKILQSKLNRVLNLIYKPKQATHGFIKSKKKENRKSIITNAKMHLKKRYVLNIDIQDFFPSINFGRVYGMFKSEPFNLNRYVATILAQLCCYNGFLPQGAPTSPIISNLICRRLDNELTILAKQNKCTYTRYADDITISTTLKKFPEELAFIDSSGQCLVGKALQDILDNNDFIINSQKVRLQTNLERQVVTGLIVNEKLNVNRKFIKKIRGMFHSWKKFGEYNAESVYYEKYNIRQRLHQEDKPTYRRILEGKINFIKMIRGQEDPIYRKFHNQLCILLEKPKNMLPVPDANKHYNHSQNKIMNMIIKGESQEIEFKETLSYCVKSKQSSEEVIFSCLKTIAGFLNCPKGGTLLIGVSDSKIIRGLDRDFKFCQNKNQDGFELKLRDLINRRFKPIPFDNISIDFEHFAKGIVCYIQVKHSNNIAHLDNKIFIRNGNQTIQLEGLDLTTWLMNKHIHSNIENIPVL